MQKVEMRMLELFKQHNVPHTPKLIDFLTSDFVNRSDTYHGFGWILVAMESYETTLADLFVANDSLSKPDVFGYSIQTTLLFVTNMMV